MKLTFVLIISLISAQSFANSESFYKVSYNKDTSVIKACVVSVADESCSTDLDQYIERKITHENVNTAGTAISTELGISTAPYYFARVMGPVVGLVVGCDECADSLQESKLIRDADWALSRGLRRYEIESAQSEQDIVVTQLSNIDEADINKIFRMYTSRMRQWRN